jgi:hypothetical protein
MAKSPQHETLTTGLSDLRLVSTIAQLMAGAIKHHTLYPEDHSIAKQHIGKIFDTITTFLSSHRTLHLDIGKNTINYDGEIAYQGCSEENDLAFLLGRDGVEWIEFTRNLELWELQALLRIINDNRRSDLEDESNIANALWEQDFPHIEYKTIDLMAMELPMLDLSGFRVATAPSETQQDQEEAPRSNREAEWNDYYTHDSDLEEIDENDEDIEAATLAITSPGSALWNLTELEQFQLETMVAREENSIDNEATIEVLFILLVLQNSEQEADDIMAFLQDRFLYSLQQHEFSNALKIVRTLSNIASAEKGRYELLKPKIAELFSEVCRLESLRDLEKFFAGPVDDTTPEELNHLWTLLTLLPSEIARPLATMSANIDIEQFGPHFLALFEHIAEQNPHLLAELIPEINKKICLNIFSFIPRLPKPDAVVILTSLALHPDQTVRSKGFSLLADHRLVDTEKLFPLIRDKDPEIRNKILELAAGKRNPTIEKLLRDYLRDIQQNTDDSEHILACYHALGKAGSAESIEFLQDVLLHGTKLGTLFASGGGPHKEGAAQALLELRLPEARAIVKEGVANMRPDVRSACRKALVKRYG